MAQTVLLVDLGQEIKAGGARLGDYNGGRPWK